MRNGWYGVLALMALGFTGCAVQKPIPMDPGIWNQKGKAVEVVMAKYPVGAAHRDGGELLLDMAINTMVTASLDDHLSGIGLYSMDDLPNTLRSKMIAKGFQAILRPEKVDLSSLPKLRNDKDTGKFPTDLSSLNAEGKADYFLILQVTSFGTLRSYYGFIPTSAPKAVIYVHGVLVDAKTNKLLWDEYVSRLEPVEPPWDRPPEYENINRALQSAVEKAKTGIVDKLF